VGLPGKDKEMNLKASLLVASILDWSYLLMAHIYHKCIYFRITPSWILHLELRLIKWLIQKIRGLVNEVPTL